MALLYPAGQQFLDSNGDPVGAGSLYVYENETTTEASIYTNAALSTAASNPITLDAAGRMGSNIYVTDGTSYTITLDNSSAAEVFSRDNVFGWSSGSISSLNYTNSATGADERTLQSRLEDFASLLDFSATGDGSTDDSGFIQDAIDSGVGVIFCPPGTYKISSQVDLASNVLFVGAGKGKTVFQFDSSFGTTGAMFSGSGVANVTFRDITFDGNNVGSGASQTRLASMISFTTSTGISFINCELMNHEYIGVAFGNSCSDILIDGCEFHTMGYSGTTSNGGAAVWMSATSGNNCPKYARFANNYIHDNLWHGLHFNVIDGIVSGNTFYNNQETHLYVSRSSGTFEPTKITITDNIFDTVTRNDISSHGVEVEIRNFKISDNIIRQCDHGGIALTDCQNGIISGNVISNVDIDSSTYSGIDIICATASPNNTKNLKIFNNRVYDDQGTPTTQWAVRSLNATGPMEYVEIYDNDFSNVSFVTTAWGIQESTWTLASCRRWNNAGTDDVEPYVVSTSITSTGAKSITSCPFQPKYMELWAFQNDTAAFQMSYARVMSDGTVLSMSGSSGGTDGQTNDDGSDYIIDVRTEANVAISQATFTAFTWTGCTYNVATHASGTTQLRFVFYP